MSIHVVCGEPQQPRARMTPFDQTEWTPKGQPPTHDGPWKEGRPVGKRLPITQDFSGTVVVLDTDSREGYHGETFIFESPQAAQAWITAIAEQIDALSRS